MASDQYYRVTTEGQYFHCVGQYLGTVEQFLATGSHENYVYIAFPFGKVEFFHLDELEATDLDSFNGNKEIDLLFGENEFVPVFVTLKETDSDTKVQYELLGVVDVANCVDDMQDELFDFFRRGHISKQGTIFLSGYTCSLTPDKKGMGDNRVPFAMFAPTKDLNPHIDRHFVTREYFKEYRKRWPMIEFKESWACWEDVLASYPGNNNA